MKLRFHVVFCFGALCFTSKVLGQVPQVSIVTSFTGVVLPPQVTIVPVRYMVDGGQERTMDIPLNCTSTQCSGNVIVIDSLRGTGSKSFTVARSTDTLTAFPLSFLQDRQELATSRTHTLVVRNGEVWGFGWNREGQLGLGYQDTFFHSNLRKVPGLNRIVSVATGLEFSVALDSAGDVWVWGSNFQGTLGNGISDPNEVFPRLQRPKSYNSYFSRSTPAKVVIDKKIVCIAAGPNHVVVSDSSGQVWGWGYNNNGIVGFFNAVNKVLRPTLAPGLSGIWRVSAGGDRVFREDGFRDFTLALDWGGGIWGMGAGLSWQLGPVVNAYSGAQKIILNLSSFPNLFGPIGIRSGEVASLLEYNRSTDGKHVVLTMGMNRSNSLTNSMLSSSVPGVQSVGGLNSQSLGGNVALQILSESSSPVGAVGQVSWRGKTTSSSNASTGWINVVKKDNRTLFAKTVSAGTSHAVALDSTGQLFCWGDDTACQGKAGYTDAIVITADSLQQLPLEIEGVGDTLYVSEGISRLTLNAKLNGEYLVVSAQILCSNGYCKSDLSARDGAGRFGSQAVIVKKEIMTNRSIRIADAQISAGGNVSGVVSNRLAGDVYFSTWRLDAPFPVKFGQFHVGKKTTNEHVFSFPLSKGGIIENGVYVVILKMVGLGWSDSCQLDYIFPSDSSGVSDPEYSGADINFMQAFQYTGAVNRVARARRLINGAISDTVCFACLLKPNELVFPGLINLRSGALAKNIDPAGVVWDTYFGGNAFSVANAGPVSDLSFSYLEIDRFGGGVFSIDWTQLGTDSVSIDLYDENGGFYCSLGKRYFDGLHRISKNIDRKAGSFMGLKITSYRNGKVSVSWHSVRGVSR